MMNYLLFREEGRTIKNIDEPYEHNERLKKRYSNNNIRLQLSGNNYYFKRPTETYQATLQKRMDAGELTDKGLQRNEAHYFSEILIGVNREYWYGKSEEEIRNFFRAAYEYIVKKFGEENILSAVVHCDEISTGICNGSEVELINYHMHIVAIPTVTKRRYYTKRSKEYKQLAEEIGEQNIAPEDDRLLKAVEKQISHSRFFQSGKDEHHRMTYSYSIWQDEILDAVKMAGYTDIHRGITEQKAPHLHPMAYKQVMAKIKEQADGCLPDFTPQSIGDDKYLISKSELLELGIMKEKIEEEIASYDMAVDALMEEQSNVYERQHKVYVAEKKQQCWEYETMQYEQLKEEAQRLREENEMLKSAIEFIKEKVQTLVSCFKKVITNWISLRTDSQVDASQIMAVIDNEVRNGITILNNEKIEKGGHIR